MTGFRFHPEALDEYAEATTYYADIRRELAEAFVFEVERGIKSICEYPQAWQPVGDGVRRYPVRRFPFGIYYTIEDDASILIVAVMHLSRRPEYWRDRVR